MCESRSSPSSATASAASLAHDNFFRLVGWTLRRKERHEPLVLLLLLPQDFVLNLVHAAELLRTKREQPIMQVVEPLLTRRRERHVCDAGARGRDCFEPMRGRSRSGRRGRIAGLRRRGESVHLRPLSWPLSPAARVARAGRGQKVDERKWGEVEWSVQSLAGVCVDERL